MAGFWDRILGRSRSPGSAEKAKERLRFILLHDRISLPPERLKMMKEEILAVISKDVAVTGSDIDIALKQRDRHSNMLIAEIPFLKGIQPPQQERVEDEVPILAYEQDEGDDASDSLDSTTESATGRLGAGSDSTDRVEGKERNKPVDDGDKNV
jgi:cell division topological specificity factor